MRQRWEARLNVGSGSQGHRGQIGVAGRVINSGEKIKYKLLGDCKVGH